MKFFFAITALLLGVLGFAKGMPLGDKTTKHHLLHILEDGGKGGHKVHVDRQQNFEIIDDGKVAVKCVRECDPGL